MTLPTQLIVFSDLDGTLLDHESYSWQAARPAVDALRQRLIPLVPVTSKTRAELQSLRADLKNRHPYVVENGAAIYVPDRYFSNLASTTSDCGEHLISTGPQRDELQQSLLRARNDSGFLFKSFTELGADGIASLTGLSRTAAGNANKRAASEPLLWEDTAQRLQEFSAGLSGQGLRCVRGGRFVHVMGRFDKVDAVAKLVSLYARKYSDYKLVTVVLGDGPNDLQMLAYADIAVVVKGKHDYDMSLATKSRVIRTSEPGPVGWNKAILDILRNPAPDTSTARTPN